MANLVTTPFSDQLRDSQCVICHQTAEEDSDRVAYLDLAVAPRPSSYILHEGYPQSLCHQGCWSHWALWKVAQQPQLNQHFACLHCNVPVRSWNARSIRQIFQMESLSAAVQRQAPIQYVRTYLETHLPNEEERVQALREAAHLNSLPYVKELLKYPLSDANADRVLEGVLIDQTAITEAILDRNSPCVRSCAYRIARVAIPILIVGGVIASLALKL